MNYLSAFAISASGMDVEKQRLDITALNIANAHSTRASDGTAFVPLQVISSAKNPGSFQAALAGAHAEKLAVGAEVVQIRPLDSPPRLVYEPGHPDADKKGFVSYPGINPVNEMVNLISTMRAYEANLAAVHAAKTMALRALEIGGES